MSALDSPAPQLLKQRPAGRRHRDIPGPAAPAPVQTAQFFARPDSFLERNWRRYGDVFRARIMGFGTGKAVVIADPAAIEQMFKASPQKLLLGEIAKGPVIPIAGPNSLLALDQPQHLQHRKLLLPAFHGERMRAYTGIVAEATERSIAGWPIGEPFSLRPRMADITLEVIMRGVFGLELGERQDEMRRVLLTMIDTNLHMNLALTFPKLRRDFGPIRTWSRFRRAKERADEMIYDEISRRRKASDLERREDILSMLITARDKQGEAMSDEELHDELITMLLAGHETTATALAWAFGLILHHPAVLARLRGELGAGEEDYLEAVVNESLRLRPTVLTSQRVLTEPMELGGFELEARTTAMLPIWLIHRRPELYPDPLVFKPERFLGVRPATYEWIPFGGGVRRCIGANFAPMEMREVVKQVLALTELEPVKPQLEPPRNRVVLLAPKHGTLVIRHA